MIFKNNCKSIFTRTPIYKSLSLLSAFSSTFIAVNVVADPVSQANDQIRPVEEVIVTAYKRDQLIKDFPGSITVIKPDSSLLTLSDIANQVPGFSALDAGPRNPTQVVMRGLRVDPVNSYDLRGDGTSVASYVDNIPLQGYYVPPAFSLKDLQQIEVLRGPQGTLYGNSSIGGLIRYITAKPDLTKNTLSVTASLSQTKESDGLNYDTDLVVNVPIVNDTLGLRLLLGKEHNEGFIDNNYLVTGPEKDINSDQTKQARVSLLWQATPALSLGGSYHYQKINVDDRQAANPLVTGDDYASSNKYLQPMQGELRLSDIDLNYQFDWAKLTASVNRYDYKTVQRSDQTDYLATLDETYGWNFYVADPNFSAYTTGDFAVIKNSAEVRFVSPDDQPLRWLVGGFYSDDDLHATTADTLPGFAEFLGLNRPDELDYYATQDEKLKEHSFYGELAYDILSAWEVSVGARHYSFDDDINACSVFPISSGIEGTDLPLDCLANDSSQSGTLGKFSTKYKFNSDHTAYFTIAEGLRRGGANLLPVEIDHNRYYRPDTSTNYELGAHSNFFNQQVQLNAAVFYMDWDDVQVASRTPEGYSATLNAQTARSKGIELESKANLSTEWSLRAGFSLTDAKLTKTVMGISGGTENAYDGDTLPGSPRTQWNVGADYRHQINNLLFNASITYARNSEIYSALNKEFADYYRLDGFDTANIRFGVSMRNWRVDAFVNNMSNERGITGKRTANLFGDEGQYEYITRPRTLGVSINYHY